MSASASGKVQARRDLERDIEGTRHRTCERRAGPREARQAASPVPVTLARLVGWPPLEGCQPPLGWCEPRALHSSMVSWPAGRETVSQPQRPSRTE